MRLALQAPPFHWILVNINCWVIQLNDTQCLNQENTISAAYGNYSYFPCPHVNCDRSNCEFCLHRLASSLCTSSLLLVRLGYKSVYMRSMLASREALSLFFSNLNVGVFLSVGQWRIWLLPPECLPTFAQLYSLALQFLSAVSTAHWAILILISFWLHSAVDN